MKGLITVDLLIQPLNHSVVFLKEKDVDISAYEKVIPTIRGDLLLVERQKREFASVSELKQIEALTKTLESKLQSSTNFAKVRSSKRLY